MLDEIITLQLGHMANYVGAHWWNAQQTVFNYDTSTPICRNVLFREGLAPNGEVTLTPRLVCVDLAGSVSRLPPSQSPYHSPPPTTSSSNGGRHDDTASALWHEPLELHQQQASHDNNKMSDDAGVKHKSVDDGNGVVTGSAGDDHGSVWSHLLSAPLHPRSTVLLSNYQHNNDTQRFDVFGYGVAEYENQEFGELFEDRVRQYAEECDFLAGFHMMADGDGGFGGVCRAALQHLSDEYSTRPVFSLPLLSSHQPTSHSVPQSVFAAVNSALTLDSVLDNSVLCCPISLYSHWPSFRGRRAPRHFPSINYNPGSYCHTAAILACVVDSITLPWRLRDRPTNQRLVGVANELTSSLDSQCALAAASLSLPLPARHNDTAALCSSHPSARSHALSTLSSVNMTQLMPAAAAGLSQLADAVAPACDGHEGDGGLMLVTRDHVNKGAIPWAVQCVNPSVSCVDAQACPMILRSPFPLHMFSHNVTVKRNQTVGVAAMLNSSPHLTRASIAQLHSSVASLQHVRLHRHAASGLELEEWHCLIERLSKLALL